MIRKIRQKDIPRLKELEADWEFGDDFIDGLVAVDQNDVAVGFCGAWMLAEVHVALDKQWSTPGARLCLLKEIHDAMNDELKRKGFDQVVTWFEESKAAKRFQKRLGLWGWMMSAKRSFHRRLT